MADPVGPNVAVRGCIQRVQPTADQLQIRVICRREAEFWHGRRATSHARGRRFERRITESASGVATARAVKRHVRVGIHNRPVVTPWPARSPSYYRAKFAQTARTTGYVVIDFLLS